jgi:hypothetical protein
MYSYSNTAIPLLQYSSNSLVAYQRGMIVIGTEFEVRELVVGMELPN